MSKKDKKIEIQVADAKVNPKSFIPLSTRCNLQNP
ncbi:Uncharacterised protein [Streptococcus pneumoniae]|nr:Uncharacterised protein [Streptococcus pneumoniae]